MNRVSILVAAAALAVSSQGPVPASSAPAAAVSAAPAPISTAAATAVPGVSAAPMPAASGPVATASRRYLIRHANDNVCRTLPCWNWVGVDVASGHRIFFDAPAMPRGFEIAPASERDKDSRLFGLLVEAPFTVDPNRLHIDWAHTLVVTSVVEAPALNP